jgi:hypothetical protein
MIEAKIWLKEICFSVPPGGEVGDRRRDENNLKLIEKIQQDANQKMKTTTIIAIRSNRQALPKYNEFTVYCDTELPPVTKETVPQIVAYNEPGNDTFSADVYMSYADIVKNEQSIFAEKVIEDESEARSFFEKCLAYGWKQTY